MARSADEILKYRLASKLEAQKWRYRKEELAYLEAGQHMRSLNQIMWQVPSMAIAITGGLWYSTIMISAETPKIVVLFFVIFVDFVSIIVLHRLRDVIQNQLEVQREFSGAPPIKRNRTVIRCWSALLTTAGLISFFAATNVYWFSKPTPIPATPISCQSDITLKIDASSPLVKGSQTIPSQELKRCN